jgi:sterol desaturase/sphingolipid hydroxylase (fatty acid hydroxylase superfamily)
MTFLLLTVAFLAGWFAWTLGEYLMHRFAMHEMKGKGLASREHLTHHADRDSILEKWPIAWAGIVTFGFLTFFVVGGFALGHTVGFVLWVGWVFGYGFYDLHHWRAHRRPIANRYEAKLRRHHFHHHFGHPMTNHCVTMPLWDHVFGTYVEPGMVRVPRRMAMVWLLDDDGNVKPEYADAYEIVGVRERSDVQAARDLRHAFANQAPELV